MYTNFYDCRLLSNDRKTIEEMALEVMFVSGLVLATFVALACACCLQTSFDIFDKTYYCSVERASASCTGCIYCCPGQGDLPCDGCRACCGFYKNSKTGLCIGCEYCMYTNQLR